MLIAILVALCAIGVFVFFLILPAESSAVQRAPFWGVNHAHRGLHTKDRSVPENSMAAFTAAVDAGYGIELDVHLTKDGEVIVFHDDTLQRMCGVDKSVDECTLEELREMRLYDTDQSIPTLWEVLELVQGRVPLIIELKHSSSNKRNKALCKEAWRNLRLYDGDICIQSFNPLMVRWYKKNVPGLLRGQLSASPHDLHAGIGGLILGCGLLNCVGRPHFISYKEGKKPMFMQLACQFAMRAAWTVNTQENGDVQEDKNEIVIFEHYLPAPRFAYPPTEPSSAPDAEDEYRF